MSRTEYKEKYRKSVEDFKKSHEKMMSDYEEYEEVCKKEPPRINYIPNEKIKNLLPIKEFCVKKNLGDYSRDKPEVFFATRTHYCDFLKPLQEDTPPQWADFVYFINGK